MNRAVNEANNHEFVVPAEFAIELAKNDSDIKFQELQNRTRTDSGGFLVVGFELSREMRVRRKIGLGSTTLMMNKPEI